MKLITPFLCTAAFALVASPAVSEVNGFGNNEGFTLGLGIVADSSPYEGTDSPSATLIPYIAYDWEHAHLGIDGFSYSFFNSDSVTVSVLLEPRWSFGDPEDSPLFKDIERDTAVEAGLEAEMTLGKFFAAGRLLQDISDVHDGFEGMAEVGYQTDFGDIQLSTSVGYTYRDKDLSEHLYGVRAEEARADLNAYAPDAAWYPYLSADAAYALGDSMAIVAFAKYEHLYSDATDSPLIDQDHDATFGVALLKRF